MLFFLPLSPPLLLWSLTLPTYCFHCCHGDNPSRLACLSISSPVVGSANLSLLGRGPMLLKSLRLVSPSQATNDRAGGVVLSHSLHLTTAVVLNLVVPRSSSQPLWHMTENKQMSKRTLVAHQGGTVNSLDTYPFCAGYNCC